MTTHTEDRLTALGAEPAPSARPEFVAELEDRLRGLPTVEAVRERRVAPTRWLAAGVAAALLALLGVGLFDTGGERALRTLAPTASSTLEPQQRDEPDDDKAAHQGDAATDAPPSSKDDPQRTPPSSQPTAEEAPAPATLRAAAFQHHTRVMVFWEKYEKADFAFYEVRRADEHRPGYSVVTRIRDHEEHGTADELRHPDAQVRYQIVVVSRDGREVAISEWITPEERPADESSESQPIVTIP